MTEAAPTMSIGKPRRILILGSAAGALIAATWWSDEPDIDPRIVGTWTIHSRDTSPTRVIVPRAKLRSDGTATFWANPQNPSDIPAQFRWSVDANRLIWHGAPGTLSETAQHLWDRVSVQFFSRNGSSKSEPIWRIVAVTPDEIDVDINIDVERSRWTFRREE